MSLFLATNQERTYEQLLQSSFRLVSGLINNNNNNNKFISTVDWKNLLACENIHFSSLFAAGDLLGGGTSAIQRHKFHTDDANQCLHNKINLVVMGFQI